jgi:ABC-2 type transport system permease protein
MLLLVVIVVAFGALAYGVELPTETMPAFALTLIVGSAAFCALGLAVTALVPNAEAAPAIVNALVFPLLFLSGTFFPIDNAPEWLQAMAGLFPVRHLLEATTEAFLPSPDNPSGLLGMSLLVMLAWAVAGLLVAIRFFRWEPRR